MLEKKHVNAQHKDRLFNFIFGQPENREWVLSLYNAVNDSCYTDASMIEFNTLENVLYIAMRNDTSFLISGTMNVYEHQSSYNPNMPLRLLDYVSDLFSGYIKRNQYNKYGSSLIPLPTPKLLVFYNGLTETEDETILKLSDSFDPALGVKADIEVRVRMLNVNYGRNEKIMQMCKPLEEYSWFVEQVRKAKKEGSEIEEAVDMALEKMPQNFLIRGFLIRQRAEVFGMLDTEYNEAEIKELFMEEGRKEGREEERKNTEKEKARADAAEAEVKRLKKLLEEKEQS